MTPLESAEKALEIHDQGRLILESLVKIETERKKVLNQIRKYKSSPKNKDESIRQAEATLFILNRKRFEAQHNYHKYVVKAGTIV